MKKLILSVFIFLLFAAPSFAATINASSCSLTDVRNAHTSAAIGDTIVVPPGACNWNDTFNITKAITLQGAGSGSNCTTNTCITSTLQSNGKDNQTPMLQYYPTAADIASNQPFRITAIRWDASAYSPVIRIQNTITTTIFSKLRIDNNYLTNIKRTYPPNPPGGSSYYGFPLGLYGAVNGVVDNNTFNANTVLATADSIILVTGSSTWKNTTGLWTDWDNGTSKTIFFEDNVFISNSMPQRLLAGQGGNYVSRYNTFDYRPSPSSYYYVMDTHGHQGGSYYAAFGAESYGNKVLGKHTNMVFAEWRGGRIKAFYNKLIVDTGGGNVPTIRYWDSHGCCSGGNTGLFACPAGTLYPSVLACSSDGRTQTVEKAYSWSNRYSTAGVSGAGSPFKYTVSTGGCNAPPNCPVGYPNCACTFPDPATTGAIPLRVSGVDTGPNFEVWLPVANYTTSTSIDCNAAGTDCVPIGTSWTYSSAKTFTGTEGIGCGTFANRPATCTAGVGYWVPDATLDPTAASCTDLGDETTGWYGPNNTKAKSVGGKVGKLYICTGNAWGTSYEPYTYPHPLRSSTDTVAPVYQEGSAFPTGQVACPDDPVLVPIGFTVSDSSPSSVVCYGCNSGASCTNSTSYASIAALSPNIAFTSTCTGASCAQTATNSSACTSSKLVYARCTDGTNAMTSSVSIPYTMASEVDSTVPTILTKTIDSNGLILNLTFSEAIKVGTGGSGGWTLSRTRSGTPGNVTVTCPASASNVEQLNCTLASVIYSTDTAVTLAYTQPGHGIEDMATTPNQLATISPAVSVTNNSTQTGSATYSLFNHSDTPSYLAYTQVATRGVRFKSSVAGTLTHVWFYKGPLMDGATHVGKVYCADSACGGDGTLLGSKTFSGETSSGWQSQALDTPITVLADTYYTVAVTIPYHSIYTLNYYLSDYSNSYFTAGTDNGKYINSTSTYPNLTSGSRRNYWIDFTFAPAGAGGPWQVTTSKEGTGCITITDPVVVEDEETTNVTLTILDGWKATWSGTCGGAAAGNVYTTNAVSANCTVIATCTETTRPPWLSP